MLILPLVGLLGVESVLALLLIIPVSHVTHVALLLSSSLNSHPVRIVLGTLGGTLTVLLAASSLRVQQLQRSINGQDSATSAVPVYHEARQELFQEGLQTCLLVGCLLLGLSILRMQEALRTVRKQQANTEVLLKQAKGTQMAYMQQIEEREKAEKEKGKALAAKLGGLLEEDTAKLKKENADLKFENEDLLRDVRKAGASVAALKKQTEGLQLEFSRLLEENDSLRAQLAVFDRKYSQGDEKKRS